MTLQQPMSWLLFCVFLNSYLLHPLLTFSEQFLKLTRKKQRPCCKENWYQHLINTFGKNPHKQQELRSGLESDSHTSPHSKILTLSYNAQKQIPTQHREALACKSIYPQCKCCACYQHFLSLRGAYADQHNKTATLTEFLGIFVV